MRPQQFELIIEAVKNDSKKGSKNNASECFKNVSFNEKFVCSKVVLCFYVCLSRLEKCKIDDCDVSKQVLILFSRVKRIK